MCAPRAVCPGTVGAVIEPGQGGARTPDDGAPDPAGVTDPAGHPVPVEPAAGPRPQDPGAAHPAAPIGHPYPQPAGSDPGPGAYPYAGALAAPVPPLPAPSQLRNPLVPPPPEERPPHRWGLGVYVVAEAVFLGLSVAMGFVLGAQPEITAGWLAAAVGVPTAAAALVALLLVRLRGNGPIVDLRIRFRWRDVGLGLAFGFGGLFVSLPAAAVYAMLAGPEASSAVGDVFGGISADPGTALIVLFLVVVVAPLCEEILYRGVLWGAFARLRAKPWMCLVLTTIVFSVAHLEFERTLLLLVVAIPIGLARLYTDGLVAPVVAHMVNNLLPGIGLYLVLTGGVPGL